MIKSLNNQVLGEGYNMREVIKLRNQNLNLDI